MSSVPSITSAKPSSTIFDPPEVDWVCEGFIFSISKQYNVKLEDVRNWNKLSGSELNVGQELQIVPANQSISEQQATAAVAPAAKANLEIAAEKKASDRNK